MRGGREALIALGVALLVITASILCRDQPGVRRLDTLAMDILCRWRPVGPRPQEVAILMVDDASLARLGRWPLNRHVFAKAVRGLKNAGAAVIAFDVLFPEPADRLSAEQRRAVAMAAAEAPDAAYTPMLDTLATDDPDADLATAIREAGNVLLPFALEFAGPHVDASDRVLASAYVGLGRDLSASGGLHEPHALLAPLPMLADAAVGLGDVSFIPDVDSTPRYDYAGVAFDGDFYPPLSIRAAAEYLRVPWSQVTLSPGLDVVIGPLRVPTDRATRFLFDYRPRGTVQTYSFVAFLDGKLPEDALRGRVVVIGGSFSGNEDAYTSPFGSTPVPGAERHADEIDTILSGGVTRVPAPEGRLLILAAALALALASGAMSARIPTRAAAFAVIVPSALWLEAAHLAFDHRLLIPLAAPVMALALANAAVLLFRYWVTDRAGRVVRSQFRQYVSPQMVDLLAAEPHRLQLGGEKRELTIMFSDIRGFTTISEALKDRPEALTLLINRFLTPMSDTIMAHDGTIDKYIGDCVMAFWNAPLHDSDHARHACAAALAMQKDLAALNRELDLETGDGMPKSIHAGIGLNTGVAVVGNMGSDKRFDYSVLGDAVNLASRLEGLSKTYGVDIVIGEATRQAAPELAALELDEVAVKGKHEAVRVYWLAGDERLAATAGFQSLAAGHRAVLAAFRAHDWAAAAQALDRCETLGTGPAATYAIYRERIAVGIAAIPKSSRVGRAAWQ